MFIQIDNKNRVVLQIAEKFSVGMYADNVTTFRVHGVEILPNVGRDECLCYDPIMKTFYTEKSEVTEEQKAKAKARATAIKQKETALKWLADNDWKVNKRTLGEWAENDERWIAYLAERAKVRAEYDEAVAILNA